VSILVFLTLTQFIIHSQAIQKQFIFAELLYLASGAGTAGAKGLVTDATTQLALPDINVSVSQNGKKTVTDGKGHYEITQMASGTYNFTFSGIGYQPKIVTNFEVKVGTVSTLNVQLTPTV
jgi:hypothetical protein